MNSKNNALAKLRHKAVFDEHYSEKDFENDCRLFDRMVLDLSPSNQSLFAYYYLSNLKDGKVNNINLVKYKTALLINPNNREWLKSKPKGFLKKIKRTMEDMKKKVKK